MFGPGNMHSLHTPHNNALVIQCKIVTAMVCRILMDTGTSIGINNLKYLKKFKFDEKDLEAVNVSIIGFGGQTIYSLGTKKLPIRVSNKDKL